MMILFRCKTNLCLRWSARERRGGKEVDRVWGEERGGGGEKEGGRKMKTERGEREEDTHAHAHRERDWTEMFM